MFAFLLYCHFLVFFTSIIVLCPSFVAIKRVLYVCCILLPVFLFLFVILAIFFVLYANKRVH